VEMKWRPTNRLDFRGWSSKFIQKYPLSNLWNVKIIVYLLSLTFLWVDFFILKRVYSGRLNFRVFYFLQ
jgi:hypothetical protein